MATFANSSLAVYTHISPHKRDRTQNITKITIHHMAGNVSVESCGNVFQGERVASSNYGIGSDGRVAMYVEERHRAITSSSTDNDNQAVTIEVANNSGAPNWLVSDKAYNALLDLCVDICRRNGIEKLTYDGTPNGSLTHHQMFAPTTCPGPYLLARFPQICDIVNERLGVKLGEPSGTGDNPSPWAKDATEWAKKLGLFAGDGAGNYGWQETVTREALAVVLCRLMGG